MNWTDWLVMRLCETGSPYAGLYHSGLETQFQPLIDDDALDRYFNQWSIHGDPRPIRIPKNGNVNPIDNDDIVDFNPELVSAAGCSWWNWKDGVTEACFFDFDFGHGGKALDDAGIALVDEWAERLPYVQNATSKSGKGRHWLIRLENPLAAKIRSDHSRNCAAIMAGVSKDLGFDLSKYVCSFGNIQYIYAKGTK